jgi:photosystem II stability/assembly factor-like uncharacterized protein
LRTIYASAGGHIFVTFNANATPSSVVWEERDGGLPLDRFPGLLVDPTNNQIAYAVRDHFDGGHVFQTTDGGLTWTDISGDLPNLPAHTIALDPRTSPNTLYVGLDDGVYASTDLGAHWVRFQTGLPNVVVADLRLNTDLNILAAGTHGRGMWQILVGSGGGGAGPSAGTSISSTGFWELAVATADSPRTVIPVAPAAPGGAVVPASIAARTSDAGVPLRSVTTAASNQGGNHRDTGSRLDQFYGSLALNTYDWNAMSETFVVV